MSQPWDLPERAATPEAAVPSRRRFLKRLALGASVVGGVPALYWWWRSLPGRDEEVISRGRVTVPGEDMFPAARSPRFAAVDRPVTREAEAARYCNFYEFTWTKSVWREVAAFRPVPWTLRVDGLVANPRTFDLDDLAHAFPLEERIYRHRCVEAWAMAVPWTGFPLAALARMVRPLPAARYVRFVTFYRPDEASRQKDTMPPWPYNEGLTLAEATNELTFVATGMYGHPLLKQNGAPVRLVVPWKYGFKSAKSLVRIEFTAEQPATFWNTVAPAEYDFWANVNPDVPHPRWSQATERMLGTDEIRPTHLYNGYGEWVAHLYRT